MKHPMTLLVPCIAASLLCLVSCGPSKPTLHIYNWCDYLSEDVIEAFEKQYNCKISQDIFDSNEMLEAKLKGGASDYDIIVPSHYAAVRMYEQGLLRKLDLTKIPNVKNLDAAILAKLPDAKMEYSVPYLMSYTGIGYRKDKVENFEPSWKMLGREDLKGRVMLLDDLRETIGSALRTLGYSCNTTDRDQLRQAGQLVMQWKQNASKFDNEQYKNSLASGESYLVMGYVGDMLQVQEDCEDIEVVLPKEGTQFSIDLLAIPANSKQTELAYAFINFVHEPENAAKNTEFTYYLCPNTPSYELVDEEVRGNEVVFAPQEVLDKSEPVNNLGDDIELYNKLWQNIKAKDQLEF